MKGMTQHALTYIVEVEDITLGLKAYGGYLINEYRDKGMLSLSEIMEGFGTEMQVVRPFGSDLLSPEADLQSQYSLFDDFSDISLTVVEKEFFDTYSSVKDIAEAAALCALTYEEGKRVYDRVKARAKRRVQGN